MNEITTIGIDLAKTFFRSMYRTRFFGHKAALCGYIRSFDLFVQSSAPRGSCFDNVVSTRTGCSSRRLVRDRHAPPPRAPAVRRSGAEFLSFVLVNIALQAAIAAACAYLIVFRVFGRDYDAAVISAGFVGIALGSTASTLAIMAAVATQYGRSQKPFIIVPLACGIFVDIINSTLIAVFAAAL